MTKRALELAHSGDAEAIVAIDQLRDRGVVRSDAIELGSWDRTEKQALVDTVFKLEIPWDEAIELAREFLRADLAPDFCVAVYVAADARQYIVDEADLILLGNELAAAADGPAEFTRAWGLWPGGAVVSDWKS